MWLELVLVCGLLPTNSLTQMTALPEVKVCHDKTATWYSCMVSDQKQKTSTGQSMMACQG